MMFTISMTLFRRLDSWVEKFTISNLILFESLLFYSLMVWTVTIQCLANFASIVKWRNYLEVTIVLWHVRQSIHCLVFNPSSLFATLNNIFLEFTNWQSSFIYKVKSLVEKIDHLLIHGCSKEYLINNLVTKRIVDLKMFQI